MRDFDRRRVLCLFLFVFVFASAFRFSRIESLANSPAPARCFTISPEHVPAEAEYLELLIPMSQEDPYYRSFNQSAAEKTGLTEDAPIARYVDEDGYISYSFHMAGAVSEMKLEDRGFEEEIYFSQSFGDGAYAGSQTHLEYIQENFGTIKAALLDGQGNILAVSEAASVVPGRHGYLAGTIAYDCADGSLSPSMFEGYGKNVLLAVLVLLLLLASFVVRAAFTGLVECLVGLIFQIRPLRTVFLVNIVSNIIFNLLLAIGTAMFYVPYLYFVIVGEAAVVWAEYQVYRRKLVSCQPRRILVFTVVANLASLLLGIGVRYLLPVIGLYGLKLLM